MADYHQQQNNTQPGYGQGYSGQYSKFLGLEPLEGCCCCTLKTGVKILGILQLIGGIGAIFGLIGMILLDDINKDLDDSDDSYTYFNWTGFILYYAFTILYIPIGIVGIQAGNLNLGKAKSYYGCNVFAYPISIALNAYAQYSLCQSIDTSDQWTTTSCTSNGSMIGSAIGSAIFAFYFLWVMKSYSTRLDAGETDLCMFGAHHHHHNQGNLGSPLVAQGQVINQNGQQGYNNNNQNYNNNQNNNNNQGYNNQGYKA